MTTKTKRTKRIESERDVKKRARRMAFEADKYENEVRRLYAGVKYPEKFLKNSIASAMLILVSQAADHYIYDIENFCGIKYRDAKGLKLFKDMQTSLDRVIAYLDGNSKKRFMREGLNGSDAAEAVNFLTEIGNAFEAYGEYLLTYCILNKDRWRFERMAKMMDELATPAARESVLKKLMSDCREGLENCGVTSEQLDGFLAEGKEPAQLRLCFKDPSEELVNTNVITPKNINI